MMPIGPGVRMLLSVWTSVAGIGVTPGPLKFTCHSGRSLPLRLVSASNAYTLLLLVATKTTLWVPFPATATLAMTSGWV